MNQVMALKEGIILLLISIHLMCSISLYHQVTNIGLSITIHGVSCDWTSGWIRRINYDYNTCTLMQHIPWSECHSRPLAWIPNQPSLITSRIYSRLWGEVRPPPSACSTEQLNKRTGSFIIHAGSCLRFQPGSFFLGTNKLVSGNLVPMVNVDGIYLRWNLGTRRSTDGNTVRFTWNSIKSAAALN